jgi:hypothetical protein
VSCDAHAHPVLGAAYVRVDHFGPALAVQAARETPDPYGRIWVRSLIGLML